MPRLTSQEGKLECLFLDYVRVKGRNTPVRIYTYIVSKGLQRSSAVRVANIERLSRHLSSSDRSSWDNGTGPAHPTHPHNNTHSIIHPTPHPAVHPAVHPVHMRLSALSPTPSATLSPPMVRRVSAQMAVLEAMARDVVRSDRDHGTTVRPAVHASVPVDSLHGMPVPGMPVPGIPDPKCSVATEEGLDQFVDTLRRMSQDLRDHSPLRRRRAADGDLASDTSRSNASHSLSNASPLSAPPRFGPKDGPADHTACGAPCNPPAFTYTEDTEDGAVFEYDMFADMREELDIGLFERARDLYLQGLFDDAETVFYEAGGRLGGYFVRRCRECRASTAPWPGYYTWDVK